MTDSPSPTDENAAPSPKGGGDSGSAPSDDGGKPEGLAGKGGDPSKSRTPNVWYVVIAVAVVVVIVLFVAELSGRTREVSLTELADGLRDETYTAETVHNLRFTESAIVWSNRPLDPDEKGLTVKKPDDADEREPYQTYRVSLGGIPPETRSEFARMLRQAGIDVDGSGKPVNTQLIITLLFGGLLIGTLLWGMRRLGGAGSPLSFGRSRGKMVSDDDLTITFDDVAGQDEATEELREIVDFLKTPQKYQALGGRIPKGVLLVGPPGTGKTLLAKAVAGEAGVPFYSLSGSDFVEMYVGVGAARVRDMFQQAVAKSPAIIFIDELDALGKVRGSGMPGGHDEREQTLNALLVEMDGFGSDESVIVMGATNRPETLDPALMRPGRFDRNVLVDRPDFRGREAILRVHAQKIRLAEDVDLGRLAKLTPGFVGADLANLCNEAALLAARADKAAVGMPEMEEAIERVVAGLEKASKVIQEDEKIRVAYHECGHALVACLLPHTDPVHKISIIPRGLGALGYTLQRPEEDRHLVTVSELRNRICCLLGGIAAEDTVFEEASTGASNDLERATDLARRMVTEFGMSRKLGRVNYRQSGRSPFLAGASTGATDFPSSERTLREIDEEIKRIIDESMATAREIMRDQRNVLERMTRDLLDVEVMDANQLAAILDELDVPTPRGSRPTSNGDGTTIAPPDADLTETARPADI